MKKRKRKERFAWPKAGIHNGDIRKTSILKVDWTDATGLSSWKDPVRDAGSFDLVKVSTIGYLVRLTKTYLALSSTITTDAVCSATVSIPRRWVQRIQVVQRAP